VPIFGRATNRGSPHRWVFTRFRWVFTRLRQVKRATAVVAAAVVVASGCAIASAATSGSAGTAAAHPAAASGTTGAGTVFNQATGTTTTTAAKQLSPMTNVTLLTGDKVRLLTAPDGQQIVNPVVPAPAARAGAATDFVQFTWAGDHYTVPDVAVPYLRTGVLDPRLFDVSYLARAKFGATLPVRVSYSGTATPSLPGLDVTHASDGTATGTLATAQGTQLASLLTSAQASAIASKTSLGRLAGITSISLAPSKNAPPLPASPTEPGGLAAAGYSAAGASPVSAGQGNLHYYTVTLKFIGPDGSAGTAIGFLQNLDDINLSPGPILAADSPVTQIGEVQGSISLSVPAGNYSAEFSIITPHPGTDRGYDGTLVTDLQFSVNADKTITLNARGAVPYDLTLSGVSAPDQFAELSFTRTDNSGAGVASVGLYPGLLDLVSLSNGRVSSSVLSAVPTTGAVTQGKFELDATTQISNAQGAAPYYFLNFPYENKIPSSLTFNLTKEELTAYTYNFYADPAGSCGGTDTLSVALYQAATGLYFDQYQDGTGMTPGTSHTTYWYDGDPRLDLWQPLMNDADCNSLYHQMVLLDAPRTISDGTTISEDWGKAPLGAPPSAASPLSGFGSGNRPASPVCGACRQDDNALFFLRPYGDSDPGHYGNQIALPTVLVPSAVSFYRNGQLAITNPVLSGESCSAIVLSGGQNQGCALSPTDGQELPLLPQPASYELDWVYQSSGDPDATTEADWTFRSAPDATAGKLPGGEQCAPDPTRGCSYLPLLFITYNLPLTMDNTATAGSPFPIAFTVSHQQGEAPPAGVTATVSASFDNGQTWSSPQPAASLGNGKFTTTIQQPVLSDTSGFVSLRVTARDSAGNSVTETLIKAYGLTS
jgi:hypothetical protein